MSSNTPNAQIPTSAEATEDLNGWIGKVNRILANPQEIMDQGERPWTTSFFDCFSPIDLCCLTCWCPCITFGKTHHRINKSATLEGYSCCNGSCCIWYLAAHCGLVCIPNMIQRNDLRNRVQPRLTGNGVVDFFKAWCCPCCDLIQQEKEAEALLSNQSVVMNQPIKQEGMNYGAPPPKQDMNYGAPPPNGQHQQVGYQ